MKQNANPANHHPNLRKTNQIFYGTSRQVNKRLANQGRNEDASNLADNKKSLSRQNGMRSRLPDSANVMDTVSAGRHSQMMNDPLLKSLYHNIKESKLIQNDDNQ